jgi:hypothetical protein
MSDEQSERIEQRALERDLVAQLSPSKATQVKAKVKAAKFRDLLKRVNKRDAEGKE